MLNRSSRGLLVVGLVLFVTAGLTGCAEIQKMAEDAARGAFSLPVDATFDLADGAEAARHATQPGRWGKVLLTG